MELPSIYLRKFLISITITGDKLGLGKHISPLLLRLVHAPYRRERIRTLVVCFYLISILNFWACNLTNKKIAMKEHFLPVTLCCIEKVLEGDTAILLLHKHPCYQGNQLMRISETVFESLDFLVYHIKIDSVGVPVVVQIEIIVTEPGKDGNA